MRFPNDRNLEHAVLGGILLNEDESKIALQELDEKDFYWDKNKEIFRLLKEVYEKEGDVDLVTVETYRANSRFKDKVLFTELARLTNNVPSALLLPKYVKKLKELTAKREFVKVAWNNIEKVYRAETELPEVINSMMRDVEIPVEQKTFIKDLIQEYHDMIFNRDGTEKLNIGFERLDNFLGGMHRGSMITVAARPGVGKTSFALNVVLKVARRGIPVGFFSLEMSGFEIIVKLLALVSMMDSMKILNGVLNEKEFEWLKEAKEKLENLPIYIADSPYPSLSDVTNWSWKLRKERKVELLVIDYLQLITTRRRDSRVQEVSEISRSLKGLARKLNIPILVNSQLNRLIEKRENKEPKLSDLRDSGSIEQDSDVVIFLYEKDDVMKVKIGKNRHGRVGTIDFRFDPTTGTFEELNVEVI